MRGSSATRLAAYDSMTIASHDGLKKKALRQQALLRILEKTGYASVEELTTMFAVTPQTIRRDILELDAQGRARRYHGGVALASPIDTGTYRQRRTGNIDIKRRISRRVVELVPDGASVFLDAGSTCVAVAEALASRSGLKVVTYNLRAAMILMDQSDFTIAIPGGFVRNVDGSVIGDGLADFVRRFRFDTAIIAVSGIEADGSMGDDDQHEVAVVRAAIGQAQSVLLATGSDKFYRTALVSLGSIREVSDVVTDLAPNGSLGRIIATSGVRLHIA
jgi:DeoR family glycerol-3-phosphate regulon repressor